MVVLFLDFLHFSTQLTSHFIPTRGSLCLVNRKATNGTSLASVVKTPGFHCWRHGLNPWLGNLHPARHVVWPKIKKKIKKKLSLLFFIEKKVKWLSPVWLFSTPWTVAYQAPLSMGFSQARILEWVAFYFSRRSSWPRDWTQVSRIVGRHFTLWATREVHFYWKATNNAILTSPSLHCLVGREWLSGPYLGHTDMPSPFAGF